MRGLSCLSLVVSFQGREEAGFIGLTGMIRLISRAELPSVGLPLAGRHRIQEVCQIRF
jgi:hypothetical protein